VFNGGTGLEPVTPSLSSTAPPDLTTPSFPHS
jgi:hypothetical protein